MKAKIQFQKIIMFFMILFLAGPIFSQIPPSYKFHGPESMRDIEWALHNIVPWMELTVPPSPEILESSLSREEIPNEIIDEVKSEMVLTMQPSILPNDFFQLDWHGLPLFKVNHNFITADYVTSASLRVQIYAYSHHLTFTVYSSNLFSDEASSISDTKLVEAAGRILQIPEDKKSGFFLEKKYVNVGTTTATCGTLYCEYDPKNFSVRELKWWKRLGFVYLPGQMTIELSVFDWENMNLPAGGQDPWWPKFEITANSTDTLRKE
jgi:hypothetical protein